MSKKTPNVKVSLTPYNALAILSFLHEFIDELEVCESNRAIIEALENYENSIYETMTTRQIDDAIAESEVNFLIGKHPSNE